MTNNEPCLVCGATFVRDARMFDFCPSCIEHELAHAEGACLAECRWCTPPMTRPCDDCGAGIAWTDERCIDCAAIGPGGVDDYEDACAALVTREQARGELERHDVPGDCGHHGADGHASAWDAFVCDRGDRATYRGREVLDWLGY